jgi:DNA invertase Pin-like site-specific DNA recombinase
MTAARRLALSYSRFSDPKQGKGDSEDRQDRMFREFCTCHNLTPLAEVFADRGLSGYKDEHRKKGRLGQLIALAKDGRFEPGTVVVVEAWDRLGRLKPNKQIDLIEELLETGVQIGICRLNDVFTEEDFGTHKWTTLAVFVQLAYQESKQKAERVAASWEKRRERARKDGTLLTGRLPAWLEVVDGEVRLIEERAAAVRRIFQLAAAGYGQTRIVAVLTKEGFRPFGEVVVREGRTRSQHSGKWIRVYIGLILNDRRAIGEYQLRKGPGRQEEGSPLVGYLPAVVSEEEFLLAKAGQEQRFNRKDSLGRQVVPRQGRHLNLFKKLLRDARDGETLMLRNAGTTQSPRAVLINAAGEGGRDRRWTFPYPVFETAMLTKLAEIKPADVLPRATESPARVDVLRAKLAAIRADAAALAEDLRAGYDRRLSALLRDKGIEEERVAQELQEELARQVRPTEHAWGELPSLVEMLRTATDPAEVRLRLAACLRRVIDRIDVWIGSHGETRLASVSVHFAETVGGFRFYWIACRPPRSNGKVRRAGSWYVESRRLGHPEIQKLNAELAASEAEIEAAEAAAEAAGLPPDAFIEEPPDEPPIEEQMIEWCRSIAADAWRPLPE